MTEAATAKDHGHGQSKDGMGKLMLGALGVVFGDIGTSPLYALRETFIGHHPLPVDEPHVFGIISLIFWTMMMIVTVKYVTIILRADNRGEGGTIALQALLMRHGHGKSWAPLVAILGILATALFFGESIITPAISVLSAVEGLTVVQAGLQPLVLPISISIILALFLIQAFGTARVGALFGPITFVYFLVLAGLGLLNIVDNPGILGALSPHHALNFFLSDKLLAFLALSSVVLSVTGAEALYADMGHFGRNPIRLSWLSVVLPSLMLCYLGQGALLLTDPTAIRNPFFLLAPEELRLPLGGAGDHGDGDCLSGGDFGGLFGSRGRPCSWGICRACASCTPRRARRGRSIFPSSTGRCWCWSSCWCWALKPRPTWRRPMAFPSPARCSFPPA